MELLKWKFDPAEAFGIIEADWKAWAEKVGCKKHVIGISGGKDSTVIAALACRIFGKENVVGVSMPCGVQKDIADANRVFEILEIEKFVVDISKAVDSLEIQVEDSGLMLSDDSLVNLPPRIRTATLFLVAQSFAGGMVVNTGNLSEAVTGYSTFGGDDFGCYGPLLPFTVTEILALGDWLGLPEELVHKTPADGLQPGTDESRLGFSYADLDVFIRSGKAASEDFKKKVLERFKKNQFKSEIIRIPRPNIFELELKNWFEETEN